MEIERNRNEIIKIKNNLRIEIEKNIENRRKKLEEIMMANNDMTRFNNEQQYTYINQNFR